MIDFKWSWARSDFPVIGWRPLVLPLAFPPEACRASATWRTSHFGLRQLRKRKVEVRSWKV